MPESLTTPVYGREALRRLREQQAAAQEPEGQPSLLEQIPPDAPMDDATLTVWNSERWVAFDKWLATAPLVLEDRPQEKAGIAKEAKSDGSAKTPAQDSAVQEGLW